VVILLISSLCKCRSLVPWITFIGNELLLVWWYCCEIYFPTACPSINSIPDKIEDLTPAYFTANLRNAGVLGQDNFVLEVKTSLNSIQGYLSTIFWVDLVYKKQSSILPTSVIVKISMKHLVLRAQIATMKFTRNEISFSSKYVEESPINHPRFFFSQLANKSEKFMICSGTADGTFLDAEPREEKWMLNLDDMYLIISDVAKLQAHFDGRENELKKDFDFIGRKMAGMLGDLVLNRNVWHEVLDIYGLTLTEKCLELEKFVFETKVSGLMEWFGSGCFRQGLCHGDVHNGNIYRGRNGKLGYIDFQSTGLKPMLYDVIWVMLKTCEHKLYDKNSICELYFKEYSAYHAQFHQGGRPCVTLQHIKLQYDILPLLILVHSMATAKGSLDLMNKSNDADRNFFVRAVGFFTNNLIQLIEGCDTSSKARQLYNESNLH